jgi:hypothetical protein
MSFSHSRQTRDEIFQQMLRSYGSGVEPNLEEKEGKEEKKGQAIPKKNEILKNKIAAKIEKNNIKDAIELLWQLDDEENGIHSRFEGKEENKEDDITSFLFDRNNDDNPEQKAKPVLYRDVPHKDGHSSAPEHKGYANWAVMGLGYIEAAKKLFELNKKNITEIQNKIQDLQQNFFKDISEIDKEHRKGCFLSYMNKLVKLIQVPLALDSSEVRKQLEEVHDFYNFEFEPFSMATRFKIKNSGKKEIGEEKETKKETKEEKVIEKKEVTYLHLEVPMTGNLDAHLIEELELIAMLQTKSTEEVEHSDEKTRENEEKAKKITWFHKLKNKPYIQAAIIKHAQDILNGKIIPTQLRKYVPGLRNAGEDRLYKIVPGEGPKLIFQGYHSGTLGHEIGKGDDKLTQQSIAQAKRLTDANHLVAGSLATPLVGLEGDLEVQIAKGIRKLNQEEKKAEVYHYSSTPVHAFRHLPLINNTTGLDFIYGKAHEYVKKQREKKREHNNEGEEHTSSLVKEEKKDEYEIYKRLKYLTEKYRQIQTEGLPHGNTSHALVSLANQMAFALNQLSEYRKNPIILIDFCKSGKDREGEDRLYKMIDAIMLEETGCVSSDVLRDKAHDEEFKELEKEVRRNVTYAGVPQKQAGMLGGSLGSDGLLHSVKKYAMPSNWEEGNDTDSVSRDTAELNKGIPAHKAWYKNKNFWLGVVGIVVGVSLCAIPFVGPLIGIPTIVTSVVAAATGFGIAASLMKGITKTKNNKIRALCVLGILLGIGLCATGIGAAAGVPLISLGVGLFASTTIASSAQSGILTVSTVLGGVGTTGVAAKAGIAKAKKANSNHNKVKRFQQEMAKRQHDEKQKPLEEDAKQMVVTISPTRTMGVPTLLFTPSAPSSIADAAASTPETQTKSQTQTKSSGLLS